MGRPLPVNPDFSLVKDWLSQCDDHHPRCSYKPKLGIRFRILDLQPWGGNSDLRLVENFHNEDRYAALSHCWGASQPLKLTSAIKESFKERITYSHLPKTFQEAIAVTRALGLRYLWIDSLCIIQDSRQDWEKQCTAMVHIYRDSYVTLAAAAASSCTSGFLKPREILTETVEFSEGTDFDKIILSHRGPDIYIFKHGHERETPLSRRGWVLQETLLSRRVLSMGRKGIYLECFTNIQTEACHYPINTWTYAVLQRVPKRKIDSLQTIQELRDYWQDIVRHYSFLLLTKPADKLPALSGLASEFQQATGFEYLAGMWREDLPRGLAWYNPIGIVRKHPYLQLQDHGGLPYVAPSWSWASLPPGLGASSPGIIPGSLFLNDLEILNVKATLTGLNAFGEISDAFIEARGRMKHITVYDRESRFDILSRGKEQVAEYYPDNFEAAGKDKLDVSLLYIGKF